MTEVLAAGLIAAAVSGALRAVGRTRRLLHLFQLEHYEPARLVIWLRRRRELVPLRELAIATGIAAAAVVLHAVGATLPAALVLLLFPLPATALALRDWRREEKKPLVFTARAKRVFAVAMLPFAGLVAAAIWLAGRDPETAVVAALLGATLVLTFGLPLVLLAGNAALAPVQAAINRVYLRRARRRIATWRPLTIAITGSFGKTTTKVCTASVLEREHATLATPASYNTLLGVTRAINELLRPDHRALVVEMGAYRIGDVRELCELVRPRVGVLTTVGPAHLERFGSIEAIAKAKAEIRDGLGSDGHFVTNADDPRCREIARGARCPVTLFGVNADDADVRARDVAFAEGRSTFVLDLGGAEHTVSARLLGRHNVSNLLAAAAVGMVVGIDGRSIADALSGVEPPPHRLQPLKNAQAGIVVIDDAYNSNPTGAAAALDVLAEHDAVRRLLVTPGIVELGPLEEEANRTFGRQAAGVCDIVVLVGRTRTGPISTGLLEAGFDEASIVRVRDLDEASSFLAREATRGDVILFENDLPDTYAEDARALQPSHA